MVKGYLRILISDSGQDMYCSVARQGIPYLHRPFLWEQVLGHGGREPYTVGVLPWMCSMMLLEGMLPKADSPTPLT